MPECYSGECSLPGMLGDGNLDFIDSFILSLHLCSAYHHLPSFSDRVIALRVCLLLDRTQLWESNHHQNCPCDVTIPLLCHARSWGLEMSKSLSHKFHNLGKAKVQVHKDRVKGLPAVFTGPMQGTGTGQKWGWGGL